MQKAAAKHLWFLSDDDNLAEGAIDTVLRTTSESQADVCVFNFDQQPFSRDRDCPRFGCLAGLSGQAASAVWL
jgi:hypothetical protein